MGTAGLPTSTSGHGDEPPPAPVTPEATEWRQRTLHSVLTVTLVAGGIASAAVFLTAVLGNVAELRRPAFFAMLVAFSVVLPLRFVKRLSYLTRAVALESALFATAWAAFQLAGPQPGPTLLMSVVVVSTTLLLGGRGLAVALSATTVVVAAVAAANAPPIVPAVRMTVVYVATTGALGLLVHSVVRQIEAALRSTGEALERLRVESSERQRAMQELETTRQSLEHAQRLEAIGRLAGGVAHDFNNMLQVILMWTEVLELAHLTPEQLKGVTAIRRAAEHAAGLTRELLAFSRRQVHTVGALALDAVLADMTPSIRRLLPEDIEIRIETEPVPTILADDAQISHAILNLAINARDAMRSGGTLTLRLRSVSAEAAPPELPSRGRAWVLLEVADTGVGMDEQTRVRIFEPFFTTKQEKGTGLGLASVWGIVNQSGGHVFVESREGQGSVFRAYFPAGELAGSSEVPVRALSAATATHATVLVAEDQESVRRILAQALERAGMVALPAADGDEALRLAREVERIDVLCTDAVMPGKPTHEMIEELLQLHPECRVLLCTGYVEEELIRRRIRAGAYAHVAKPVSTDQLLKRIRALLAEDRRPDAEAR